MRKAGADTVLRLAQVFLLAHGWRRWLLAALAGAIAALAMPPFGLFPVLALSMPALVWLLDGAISDEMGWARRLRPGFAIGWWFGFGFHLAGLWWVGRAFLVEADVFAWMIPFAVVLLPAGLALFTGLATLVAGLAWRDGPDRLLLLALVLTLADWLRGHVLTGFPWNLWGYAFGDYTVLMQPAALVGVYGLGLLVVTVFCGLAGFADGTRGGRRMGGASLLLLAVVAGYGAARLSLAPVSGGEEIAIRVVQPSIPQEEKWQPENRARVFQTYLEASRAPWQGAEGDAELPRLVIWPESAPPFLLTEAPEALAAIADLLRDEDTLVTGAIRASVEDAGRRVFYNSVFVIDGEGTIRDAYDKVRLVPFGEYLPLGDLLEGIGLTKLVELPGTFRAGFRHRTLEPVAGPAFLPLICYEAIFPQAATTRDGRPGFLLNVTNDAWFGDTPGPRQHFVQSRMRAVEQGLPVVRAANTGISGVVDPYGRVLEMRPLMEAATIDTRLPSAISAGAFARYGQTALSIFLIVFLGTLLITRYLGYARND
ncbi:apolipoprotein N-acyltransferase [Stappia sp. 28M-7]|uniref:apolipoprotein N-acyltransferase n=1 Tax=Stappia sp. 28M-7 TaxID=2762596 RepID=UPI00163CB99D|nr:apolipoprotein N-acyltransferase [Stappia sp. 28M-7]MBC2857586.1 apolipoprotein N-acyltransferase [Stappia sp. 28M-7]